ncbi:cytochrome aa3 quinol oxidase subunit II [Halobacillus campisalis]|uniref:Quinol oxidase subunit 2 n=1 Tax=Halobacillus campisalis TaxID=435909 RepID=A0ABW2JYZ6_9BACI|nr:cytochrome aa3 quinol oxidase subunit II [Halobacillus campisalis]
MKQLMKKGLALAPLSLVLLLSGCELAVLDPKGPVAQTQYDLIMYSIIFMLFIVVVVFGAFAFMVIRYRENRPGRKESDYDPHMHGNNLIEIVWTVIPFVIVIALSIPTVDSLFELEKPPEAAAGEEQKEPLVIYATTADWKWFFSYPEENIETVNYLHIPTDRPIEFKLSSADAMTALWIPRLGGQKYNMAGMENTLYLQADEEGVYDGRNSNFNGEGFTKQTFEVYAESEEDYNSWVEETQSSAPELSQEEYDELLKPGLTVEAEYSSTHLEFVDHGTNEGRDYAIERHYDLYGDLMHLYSDQDAEDFMDEENDDDHESSVE